MTSLSLGVKCPVSAENEQQTQLPWTDHAMQNALWFSETSLEDLYFSLISNYRIDPLAPSYQPFRWTLSGNEDGSRFPFLTGIDVGSLWGSMLYAFPSTTATNPSPG